MITMAVSGGEEGTLGGVIMVTWKASSPSIARRSSMILILIQASDWSERIVILRRTSEKSSPPV